MELVFPLQNLHTFLVVDLVVLKKVRNSHIWKPIIVSGGPDQTYLLE